jgi:hypothetical protein
MFLRVRYNTQKEGLNAAVGRQSSSAVGPSRLGRQFRTDTRVEAGHLSGRIEHVTSRQAVEFDPLVALVALVTSVMQRVQGTSAETGP